MLLLGVSRDQIVLAEAIWLAGISILVVLHLARLTVVVDICAVSHDLVGPSTAASPRVAIVLVDLGVGGAFAISHVLRLMIHAHVVILRRKKVDKL